MTEQNLKSWPEFFEQTLSNFKDFEIRKNDRGYNVGDILLLREWDPEWGHYTGRWVKRRVTYMWDLSGLAPGLLGWVAMKLAVV